MKRADSLLAVGLGGEPLVRIDRRTPGSRFDGSSRVVIGSVFASVRRRLTRQPTTVVVTRARAIIRTSIREKSRVLGRDVTKCSRRRTVLR